MPMPAYYESVRDRGWKLGLRVTAFCFILVPLGISAVWLSLQDSRVDFFDLFLLCATIPSLIWNTAEMIAFCINRRGIHPGAHVACDLVIFVGLGIALGFFCWRFDAVRRDSLFPSYFYTYNYYSPYSKSWSTEAQLSIAFGYICTVIHMALFVWACTDVHKRRVHRNLLLSQLWDASFQSRHHSWQRLGSGFPVQSTALPPAPIGMVYVMPISPNMPCEPPAAYSPTSPTYSYQMPPSYSRGSYRERLSSRDGPVH